MIRPYYPSYSRDAAALSSKSAFYLSGSIVKFTWSGTSGTSFMQPVIGLITGYWYTDAGNLFDNYINASYGNTFNSSWVADPSQTYQTVVTFSDTSFNSTTIDLQTGTVEGSDSGNFDFAPPVRFCLMANDCHDSQNAIFYLKDLQINFPLTVIQTNRAPTTNEIGQPTIPIDPNHFKVFTNGTFQNGIALDRIK